MTRRQLWIPFSVPSSQYVFRTVSCSSVIRRSCLLSFIHKTFRTVTLRWAREGLLRCEGEGLQGWRETRWWRCGSTSLSGCNTTKPHSLYLVDQLIVSSFFQSCLNSMSSGPSRKLENQVTPTAATETRHSRWRIELRRNLKISQPFSNFFD